MTGSLPEEGFVRVDRIVGNPKARPPVIGCLPISRSTWWAGVKSGRFPKPIKLGARTTVWPVIEIRKLINDFNRRGITED